MPKPKTDRTETYTYEDYLVWDGPERWELVDIPEENHAQRISRLLTSRLRKISEQTRWYSLTYLSCVVNTAATNG